MPHADATPTQTRTWTPAERLAVFDRWQKDGWKALTRDEKLMLKAAAPQSSVLTLRHGYRKLDGTMAEVIRHFSEALHDMNEKNKLRNSRLDLLEERCARLEAQLGTARGEPDAH